MIKWMAYVHKARMVHLTTNIGSGPLLTYFCKTSCQGFYTLQNICINGYKCLKLGGINTGSVWHSFTKKHSRKGLLNVMTLKSATHVEHVTHIRTWKFASGEHTIIMKFLILIPIKLCMGMWCSSILCYFSLFLHHLFFITSGIQHQKYYNNITVYIFQIHKTPVEFLSQKDQQL